MGSYVCELKRVGTGHGVFHFDRWGKAERLVEGVLALACPERRTAPVLRFRVCLFRRCASKAALTATVLLDYTPCRRVEKRHGHVLSAVVKLPVTV